jgi:hypothetical protein
MCAFAALGAAGNPHAGRVEAAILPANVGQAINEGFRQVRLFRNEQSNDAAYQVKTGTMTVWIWERRMGPKYRPSNDLPLTSDMTRTSLSLTVNLVCW